MKKKLLIGTVLPALAAAAVIGSGFAYWVFNDLSVTNKDQNVSKNVTQLVRIGTIKEASDFTLVFDQATRPEGNTLTKLGDAQGIHVEFANGENVITKAVYSNPKSTVDNELVDIIEGKTKVVFETTITMAETVASYVKITYKGKEITPNNGEYKMSFDITKPTATEDERSFDWKSKDLEFAYVNEPKNQSVYLNLAKAVKNASNFTVVYSATIVDVDAE